MIINKVQYEREKHQPRVSQLETDRENMFNELKLPKSKSRYESMSCQIELCTSPLAVYVIDVFVRELCDPDQGTGT